MSFIRQEPEIIPHGDAPNFFLELAPAMVATEVFDINTWNTQMDTISDIQGQYMDLNRLYPMIMNESQGNRLYSQNTHFQHMASAEELINIMESNDLTMRLNIKRPDGHAATHTCIELSKAALRSVIDSAPDSNALHTLQLRARKDNKAAIPSNGEMFVTFKNTAQGHILQYVEYEISSHHDNLLLNEV
jgi:hypothetical protein